MRAKGGSSSETAKIRRRAEEEDARGRRADRELGGGVPPAGGPGFIPGASRGREARHGRDGTTYSTVRSNPRDFFSHHVQRMGWAAALGDVTAAHKALRAMQTGAFGKGGHADAGGVPAA